MHYFSVNMLKILLVFTAMFAVPSASAQQYLIVQKSESIKTFKYRTGDQIMFSLTGTEKVFSGELTYIGDSTFAVDDKFEIHLKAVSTIYRTRYFIRLLSKILLTAGVIYIGVETVNGVINNDSPMISKSTAIASSAMVGAGIGIGLLKTAKLRIGEKYKLKILNFDSFNE